MTEWELAKDEIDKLDFPDDMVGKEQGKGEYHEFGKKLHSLKSYELNLPPIRGFEVGGFYNYCPICQQVRNKKLVIANSQQNFCYEKVFLRHGKTAY